MGYLLLWLESLASAVLLVAALMAFAAAWRRRWLAAIPPALAALIILGVAATVTFGVWKIESQGYMPVRGALVYVVSWTMVFTIGACGILLLGLRSTGELRDMVARSWPRNQLAIAVAALAVLTGITFSNMDLAVKVQLASVRTEAGAIAISQAPPHVPDNENAALVYKRAFEALTFAEKLPEAERKKVDAWLDVTQPRPDPKNKELLAYLRRQERGLALLNKAAALPGCSFDHNYTPAIDMLLPELHQMREAAQMLALYALVLAAHGDRGLALDNVASLYKMAGHVNDPILISALTAVAIEAIADKALENVLELITPSIEELAVLRLDDGVSYRARVHRAIQMEEAWGLSFFGLLNGADMAWEKDFVAVVGNDDPWGKAILNSSVYRVFVLQDDLAVYRDNMKKYHDLSNRPFHEAQADREKLQQQIRSTRGGGIVAGLILPAAINVEERAALGDALHRLAQTAVALTAYREKHKNKYPDNLDALVPEFLPIVLLDPFDGRRLRMKRTDDGLILYSIGRDLKDDDGVPVDPVTGKGDLVLRLKKP